jgi:hypothetical protein
MEDVSIFYRHLVYFTDTWYILWTFGIFCGNLVYFVAIWYILWQFGIFFLFWYVVTRQNLATLVSKSVPGTEDRTSMSI